MQIDQSVVLVTGGASGLGEACCRRMLSLGARGVVAFDLDSQRGEALQQALGERFAWLKVDVSKLDEVEAGVAQVCKRFGSMHVVVNSAAIAAAARLVGRIGPLPMDVFDRGIKVNLYGTIHVMRAATLAMMKNSPNPGGERGVFINVASGAAFEGQVGQVAYSASKAAVVGMTLPLARELAQAGIRVMTIAPGAFETPMYSQVPATVIDGLLSQSLFPKRMGEPAEFALLVEEIVRNPMHNGRTIRLDGGITLDPSPRGRIV